LRIDADADDGEKKFSVVASQIIQQFVYRPALSLVVFS